jgi:hypothetical protein
MPSSCVEPRMRFIPFVTRNWFILTSLRGFYRATGVAVSFLGISLAHGQQTLDIAQVADGGAFQTTFVLSNSLPIAGSALLNCFQDSSNNGTVTWNIPFIETVDLASISIPGAGSVFLHTPGTATTLTQGWCQIQAGAGISAYAIFTQTVVGTPNQSGTAVAAAPTARVLVPFDNTSGQATSIGLANDSATQATIEMGVHADTGGITQAASIILPAQGQTAFALSTQISATTNVRGMLELFSSTGNISALALLFNPSGSFTAAPVYQLGGVPDLVPGTAAPTHFASFSANQLQFQPTGSAAGLVPAVFTPNATGGTFSVSVGGGITFTDGTFSSNGASFTAATLQSNATTPPFGTFTAPGAGTFTVSSATLTFALTPTLSFPQGNGTVSQQGNLIGTLTVTGTAAGSKTATTFAGPVSATYQGTVSQ